MSCEGIDWSRLQLVLKTGRIFQGHDFYASSSNNAFASYKSLVANPSVNQP
jgi:hypothetical protein